MLQIKIDRWWLFELQFSRPPQRELVETGFDRVTSGTKFDLARGLKNVGLPLFRRQKLELPTVSKRKRLCRVNGVPSEFNSGVQILC